LRPEHHQRNEEDDEDFRGADIHISFRYSERKRTSVNPGFPERASARKGPSAQAFAPSELGAGALGLRAELEQCGP
jgi:hypothetical protein